MRCGDFLPQLRYTAGEDGTAAKRRPKDTACDDGRLYHGLRSHVKHCCAQRVSPAHEQAKPIICPATRTPAVSPAHEQAKMPPSCCTKQGARLWEQSPLNALAGFIPPQNPPIPASARAAARKNRSGGTQARRPTLPRGPARARLSRAARPNIPPPSLGKRNAYHGGRNRPGFRGAAC